jgi:hypothetical protein
MKWYESAHKIADDISSKYGKTLRQGAAVMAALSPQKDWNMNVSLAKRVMDIYHNPEGKEMGDKEMDKAREIGFGSIADKIRGRDFADLMPTEKAAFIRIWDEANNDRSHKNIDPATGNETNTVLNEDGSPTDIVWGSLKEIAKAVGVLEDGSRRGIHDNLGKSHKVRNFYNNILDPNNPAGHVTIDTHAVAAALLRAVGGLSKEVNDNFGTPSNVNTGMRGMYPIYAEAYRQLANELGIQPRQLQSVVWEHVRNMFDPVKNSGTGVEDVDNIWKDYTDGKISQKQAQDQVHELSANMGREATSNRLFKQHQEAARATERAAKAEAKARQSGFEFGNAQAQGGQQALTGEK